MWAWEEVTKKCPLLVLPLASFGNRARDFFYNTKARKEVVVLKCFVSNSRRCVRIGDVSIT